VNDERTRQAEVNSAAAFRVPVVVGKKIMQETAWVAQEFAGGARNLFS
jgi:hypothetical protein